MEHTEQNPCVIIDHCVACGSHDRFLSEVLDLGAQPLANHYHDKSKELTKFGLGINVCERCWHAQLTYSVAPKLMFEYYLYVTGTTRTLHEYCDWFAKKVSGENIGKVLDIACNDGTQLDSFKNLGWKTYGVDPAYNLYNNTVSKGHDVVMGFWPLKEIPWPGETFDLIIAQNVVAHTPFPQAFLLEAKNRLSPTGKIYVQTSQSQMFQRGEFDTAYHEHISFFSVNSMIALARRAELVVTDVEIVPIHGDSYLYTLQHQGYQQSDSVSNMLKEEMLIGRHNYYFYKKFAKDAQITIDAFNQAIDDYKKQNIKVIGYGAAAKGITVLNWRETKLDWIVDDNPMKVGLYTPGMDIEIKSSSTLDIDEEIVIVPLAWNFYDEIVERVSKIRGSRPTKFLKCFHN